jgi:protein-L-isoaspartate O-methyltransferase
LRVLETYLAIKKPDSILELGCCNGFYQYFLSRYLSEKRL